MKVSVIIPVYQVESFLRECVESVLVQSYTDLEIILVNDGSSDYCPQICDDYAIKDNRVRVIHKENGGLSDARNAGLEIAAGEYVIFLDGDDYWKDSHFIEELVKLIDQYAMPDLLQFGYIRYFQTNDTWGSPYPYIETSLVEHLDKDGLFEYLVLHEKYAVSAWSKIIRRSVLIEHHIRFEKGLLGEDMDWGMSLWSVIRTAKIVNLFSYVYRQRPVSITSGYGIRNVEDFCYILDKWQHYFSMKPTVPFHKTALIYLAFLFPTLVRNFYLIPSQSRKKEFVLLKERLYLLKYSHTAKSDQLRILTRFFGFRLTCSLMGLWGLISKKGVRGLNLLLK